MLKKVLISESDFLLNEYEITAGLVENNKPESNIWNGAALYRTAILYPDAPNREAYIEKARVFFANGISIERDENSDEIVDGIRIGDLFIGANMFDTFACNHHAYLNIGYMNICLSNIAMLHFFFKAHSIKADDIIYHNLYEQWKLIRSTTFDDGRLLRIGGDSRIRYCYCQDYALPTWALIEDVYGEDCTKLENEWLKTLNIETEINGDGSFLSNRVGFLEEMSPVYYTRLEADRANAISMAVYWHYKYALKGEKQCDKITAWSDDFHGAAFNADGNRYASFTWKAAEKPQGLLVPKDDSSLAEWRYNLSGRVLGIGAKNYDDDESSTVKVFDGGFLTYGTSLPFSDEFLAEGQNKEIIARKYIAFAALPDDNTVLCLQYAKALNRVFIKEIAGTFWNVPNDIYNGNKRSLVYQNGKGTFLGGSLSRRAELINLGKYVNVDNKIGMVSTTPLTLIRRDMRQVGIRMRDNTGALFVEEICAPYSNERKWVDRDSVLINTGFALSLGRVEETLAMCSSLFTPLNGEISSIGITAKNGKEYVLIANFTDKKQVVDINGMSINNITDVVSNETVDEICLNPAEAVLLSGVKK